MQVKLIRLTLNNFMGIKKFEFNPQGQDMVIRGDNGTGKTTLFSAFTWLCFGKDAQGQNDFQIKTLDAQGREISNLNHSVYAELDVDNKIVSLQKKFKEKWQKKKGATNPTFTGHSTEYYIDGVPIKKKDWDSKIEELITEDVFKLLASPTHFNFLHWQKRREILLQVCGDVSNQEVIDSNSDLTELPEILGSRSLEDQRKIIKSKQQEINKRLEEIPARIDELSKSIGEIGNYDSREIQESINSLESQIKSLQQSSGQDQVQAQKAKLEADLSRVQSEADKEIREKSRTLEMELDKYYSEKIQVEWELNNADQKIVEIDKLIEAKQAELDKLRNRYKELASQKANVDQTCPTCGQDLPEDQVSAAVERFNQDKAEKLKQINDQGKALKDEINQANSERDQLIQNYESQKANLDNLNTSIQDKQQELEQAKEQPSSYVKRIETTKAEINKLQNSDTENSQQPDTSHLEQQLQEEKSKLAELNAAKRSQDRIEELKQEEKSLAKEYEELERQAYLMDQFIVNKVNLLEDKINTKFEMARFKLFKKNINGSIEPTCETLYQGVPYSAGLNNGARINVGLDIIRTLSDFYGIKTVVFCDNAESVVNLLDIDSQMIKLVVDGNYNQLTIDNQLQEVKNHE